MAACAQCGSALPVDARFCAVCAAPAEEAALGEERKVVTVLFADLVGSTALADAVDPERTRAMLDRFYQAMAVEIERAGGTVEKFIGDAVVAAFGAPAAHEDHAERALHTALAMRRTLGELFESGLALRIGVNTGEVVVGKPREGGSFVTGDAVNIGARLEQAADPGEILVGERTAVIVRGAFELDEPRTVEAKGKPEGIVCRRLIRALTLMRPRGVGGLRRAFVGRVGELELMRESYRRTVQNREPQLVTIMGDAGVGKTRLAPRVLGLGSRSNPPNRSSARDAVFPMVRASHFGRSPRSSPSSWACSRPIRRRRSSSGWVSGACLRLASGSTLPVVCTRWSRATSSRTLGQSS